MEVRVLWKSTCVLPHIKTPSQLWFFVFTAMILLELLMSFWNLFVKPVRRTRIPAYPHIRIPAYPHTRISAYPHTRIPAYPHTRISAYPHIRIPAYPHIRVPAFSTKPCAMAYNFITQLTQLFIFVLIMIALTGLKIFIADIAANYCCRAV